MAGLAWLTHSWIYNDRYSVNLTGLDCEDKCVWRVCKSNSVCERETEIICECSGMALFVWCVCVCVYTNRQACTTTMSLFLWGLCLTVSCTSPRGYWLGVEPLQKAKRERYTHLHSYTLTCTHPDYMHTPTSTPKGKYPHTEHWKRVCISWSLHLRTPTHNSWPRNQYSQYGQYGQYGPGPTWHGQIWHPSVDTHTSYTASFCQSVGTDSIRGQNGFYPFTFQESPTHQPIKLFYFYESGVIYWKCHPPKP